jgi:hypothetical protein
MAAVPLIEEASGGPAGTLVSELAGLVREGTDPSQLELLTNRSPTSSSIRAFWLRRCRGWRIAKCVWR